jgi:AcrR family transcriptional regulator
VTLPSTAPPATRERILATALRCFLSAGYEQTTIAAIRAGSGVSNGALFHHFRTKEAIAEALYVAGISSFQDGLRDILRQSPGSLHAAVLAVIGHQLAWTEQHPDYAQFIYLRGHLDFDSPGAAAVDALNRDLAAAFRRWMAPLLASGELRPMSMLMMTAIVTGPAHAIARRWLAGQLADDPLGSYAGDLAAAACAGLGRDGAVAGLASEPAVREGRVTVDLLDPDGGVTGHGEMTIRFAPRRPAGVTSRLCAAASRHSANRTPRTRPTPTCVRPRSSTYGRSAGSAPPRTTTRRRSSTPSRPWPRPPETCLTTSKCAGSARPELPDDSPAGLSHAFLRLLRGQS